MSDKVLRTRRIPNEDRLEAIIALLRAEVIASREWQRTKCDDNASSLDHRLACKTLDAAMAATDAAGALEDK